MLVPAQDDGQIIERIAALDIGKAEVVCCVRVPDPKNPGKRLQEVSTHTTMTRSLLLLCDRLQQAGVTPGPRRCSGLRWSARVWVCTAWRADVGARLLVIFRVSKPEDRSGSRARVCILP